MEAPPADPFEAMERLVSESLAAWGKDVFTVNRLLYCEEEPVCVAVETAVWVRCYYLDWRPRPNKIYIPL